MVLYGVVPECHRSVSGMVSECIMSAKMVSLSASGTVHVAKTKTLISFAVIAKLICVFAFAYAKRRFSHIVALPGPSISLFLSTWV